MAKIVQIMGGPLDGTEFETSDGASQVMVLGSDGTHLILDICDKGHAHWVGQ